MRVAGKIGEWLLAGMIGVILTTIFQKYFDREYAELWMLILPESIVFESSKVSGCSGGELGRLIGGAEKQGLQSDSQVKDSFLCAAWSDKNNPRRILEDIVTKFDKCFAIDNSLVTPKMEIKSRSTSVCTANLDLESANQWAVSATRQIYICNSDAQTTPTVQACSKSVLQSLGF